MTKTDKSNVKMAELELAIVKQALFSKCSHEEYGLVLAKLLYRHMQKGATGRGSAALRSFVTKQAPKFKK